MGDDTQEEELRAKLKLKRNKQRRLSNKTNDGGGRSGDNDDTKTTAEMRDEFGRAINSSRDNHRQRVDSERSSRRDEKRSNRSSRDDNYDDDRRRSSSNRHDRRDDNRRDYDRNNDRRNDNREEEEVVAIVDAAVKGGVEVDPCREAAVAHRPAHVM